MKKLGLILFSIFFSFQANAQTFTAAVNRNQVPQGEAFILKLALNNVQTASAPDFSPLEKDFRIYSVENSSFINVVNQNRSEVKNWNVGLIAKKNGRLTIPSITIDNLSTDPIEIEVIDATRAINNPVVVEEQRPQTDNTNTPKFMMKADVDQKTPFVQQQVNFTITLYDAGGLRGSEPMFVDNGEKDWIIKRLKTPTEEIKNINGLNYREIKFHYAFFPQKSGVLQTPEVRFDGYYLSNTRRPQDPFEGLFGESLAETGFGFADIFAVRNPVSLVANPIEISVKPIPSANNGNWWLPAENVELYSEWANENPQFRVGEAVNLNVFLSATGVIDKQLPEISFPKINNVKQYPEKTEAESVVKDGKIISTKKAPNVYIPSKPGTMTFPEISVSWYNINTNQMSRAFLPEMTVNVLPANAEAPLNVYNQEPEAETLDQRTQDLGVIAQETIDIVEGEASPYQYLYWLIALAFILGIGFSYITFRPIKKQILQEEKVIKNYPQYIREKAKDKDLRAIRDALIEWTAANNKDKKVENLKDVIKFNPDKDFENEINKIMEVMYSKSSQDWDNVAFIKVFDKVNDFAQIKKLDQVPIPKLYDKK